MQKIADIEVVVPLLKPYLKKYLEGKDTVFKTTLFTCPNRDSHSNQDSIPSCGFVPETDETIFHCFSCSKSGDIFTAYSLLDNKQINGSSFHTAVKELCDQFNVPYNLKPLSEQEAKFESVQNALSSLITFSQNYLKENQPEEVVNYIKGREWDSVVDKFQFGFLPDKPEIRERINKLYAKVPHLGEYISISPSQIVDRLLYPIRDSRGLLLGLMDRAVGVDEYRPKYQKYFLKTLERGEVLFNLSEVYPEVYIVEGASSIFTMYSKGIKNVVAVLGKEFTEPMYKALVKNGVKKVIISLDGDIPGMEGVKKTIKFFETHSDILASVKPIPEMLDPDDYIKKYGAKKFNELEVKTIFKYQLDNFKECKDELVQEEYRQSLFEILINTSNNITASKLINQMCDELSIAKKSIIDDLKAYESKKSVSDDVTMSSIITEESSLLLQIEAFEERALRAGKLLGLSTGFPILDSKLDGLQIGLMLICGKWNVGKCLREGTLVLKSNGEWEKIENLKKGDWLSHHELGKTEVVNSWASGVKPLYRITFKNGKHIDVSKDHRFPCTFGQNEHYGYVGKWGLHENIGTQWKLRTVEEMVAYIKKHEDKKYNNKGYTTNYNDVIYIQNAHLSQESIKWDFDPYLVGAVLGDGSVSTSIRIALEAKVLGVWETYLKSLGMDYSVQYKDSNNVVIVLLKQSSLRDFITREKSENKKIPDGFLLLSVEDRKRLLAGLIDTDGHITKLNGHLSRGMEYGTISPVMAGQVSDLVHSLGGRASITVKKTHYRDKSGSKIIGKKYYRMRIYLFETLPMLIKKQTHTKRTCGGLKVSKIEPIGEHRTYDIEVSAKDHLFIVENWVLSHNSSFMQSIATNLLKNPDVIIGYFSIDDSVVGKTIPRFIANLSNLPINMISKPIHEIEQNQNISDIERAMRKKSRDNAIELLKQYSGRLCIKDSIDGNDIKFVEKTIKTLRRMAGARHLVIFVDFLNMVNPMTNADRTEQESKLARFFKDMSNKYQCCIICTVEASKEILTSRISENSIKGSSSLPSMADVVLLMYSSFDNTDPNIKDKSQMYFNDPERENHLGQPIMHPIVRAQISKNKWNGDRESVYFRLTHDTTVYEEGTYDEQVTYRGLK